MTPAARIAAAIDVLERVLDGSSTEQALTSWARSNRYAGSKDRAAVRDHVFDAVRKKRFFAHYGGGMTGRSLMLGNLLVQGVDPLTLFTGQAYAPSALETGELIEPNAVMSAPVACNMQDWVYDLLVSEMPDQAEATSRCLSERAPVCLRVNTTKTTLDNVRKMLANNDIESRLSLLSHSALIIDSGVRGLRNTPAFLEGMYEFQDAASQALVDAIPLVEGGRVLDYCAGGGGKTLALAARLGGPVWAQDANQNRLKDLPARAKRAGADVRIEPLNGLFDVVLCDVPCSGSGAWRRSPDGKWALTEDTLAELTRTQDHILEEAMQFVSIGGSLIYATCSIFKDENENRIRAFLDRHPDWTQTFEARFDVSLDNDGFYTAHLQRH